MNQPADPFAPAIGACLPCRQIFLFTRENPNCVLCGQPPAYTLPFANLGPLVSLTTDTEPAEPITPSASSEELPPAVEEAPPAAGEEPSQDSEPDEDSPIVAVLFGISNFLQGGSGGEDQLRDIFHEAGAEGEEASNAVGRLVAVRDFIGVLWERFELPPTEPMEPQPEAPAAEG